MRGWISALRKPYPRAPILYSSGILGGFYFGARQAEGSDAMSKPPVNVAATSPIKSKSVPDVVEGLQCEKGWYISPFDGKKRMTADNPAFLEQKRDELDRIKQQATLGRITEEESSTISAAEEERIRAEIRVVMNQKFTAGRAKFENNLVLQNSVKSGVGTSDDEVIDLRTPSATSLQKPQPTVIPGSPVLLASTPSNTRNGGNTPGFSRLSQETVAASAP